MSTTVPTTGHALDLGGVTVDVVVPEPLAGAFSRLVRGPRARADRAGVVNYEVTAEGRGRYGLERDHGAVRHDLGADEVLKALVLELAEVVHRRRFDLVAARGSAVALDGRGIVVLGAEATGGGALLDALLDAGATLVSDGLVVVDPAGRAQPVRVGAPARPQPHDGDPSDRTEPVPVSVLVVISTSDDAHAGEAEGQGTRAVLPLLEHVAPNHQRASATRRLLRTLAPHVVLLRRSLRDDDVDVVAADIAERAAARPLIELDAPVVSGDDAATGAVSSARVRRTPHLCFDDFLPPEDHARLVAFALSKEPEFVPSEVITSELVDDQIQLRRSLTSYELDDVWEILEGRLIRLLPHVRRELGIDWFELDGIERQLTVHGDGDHFTLHVDSAGPDVARRKVSAVYYFNRTPRAFSGGELRLFDTIEADGRVEAAPTFCEVAPTDNSLVVFGSDAYHEVRPVQVPGNAFADRRFTIVCWARRAPTPGEVFTGDVDRLADLQRELLPDLTSDGFRVVATPATVQSRLAEVFESGAVAAPAEPADDGVIATGKASLIELGDLRGELLEALRPLHEEWCGSPLEPTALYGMRIYRDGQTLPRHTDRVETHIISSIVHVAADVDVPWPLVVEDRSGAQHEGHLRPGQMLLYEGARLPHSRPEALRGRHFASVFVHYRPLDWPRTLARIARESDGKAAT
jgi:predicted 2-oxoglutarate/Fe(II)-dependent dioxygenase YbiX